MKIKNTYIVKYNTRFLPLYECENGKWYIANEYITYGTRNGYHTILEEIKYEEAQKYVETI